MCLSIEFSPELRIAIEDIICYKHVIVTNPWYKAGTKAYETSYQHFPIRIGKTYKSRLDRDFEVINTGLHSFADIEDAIKDMKDEYKRCARYWNYTIVKCIIPKGAEYYVGRFEGMTSYASNRIKYVEIDKTKYLQRVKI